MEQVTEELKSAAEAWGICRCLQFELITPMREQNRIFISQVFEMEVSMEICRYPNIVQIWKPRGFHGNHVISKKICFLSSRFEVSNWNSPQLVRVEAVHFSWKPRGFHGNLVTTKPIFGARYDRVFSWTSDPAASWISRIWTYFIKNDYFYNVLIESCWCLGSKSIFRKFTCF